MPRHYQLDAEEFALIKEFRSSPKLFRFIRVAVDEKISRMEAEVSSGCMPMEDEPLVEDEASYAKSLRHLLDWEPRP